MSLNASTFSSGMAWTQVESNAPFGSRSQGPDSIIFKPSLNLNVTTQVQALNFTLAAGGFQNVDLRSFTNLLGTAITGTNATGVVLNATLTNVSNMGGMIRIAPGNTNPITWFFSANSGTNITLNVGAYGAGIALCDGSPVTVNATSRNIAISNPGTNSVTVKIGLLQGN